MKYPLSNLFSPWEFVPSNYENYLDGLPQLFQDEPCHVNKVDPSFLGKVNKIRALVANVFNAYQDQFELFLDHPDLINDYPTLEHFIHNLHVLACTQQVHEKTVTYTTL